MSRLDHCTRCGWDRLEAEHNSKMAERCRIIALLRKHFAIERSDPNMATFFGEFGEPVTGNDLRSEQRR